MSVYRPAPEVPSLPLPRRHVERLALVVTWAAFGVVFGAYVVNQVVAPATFGHAPNTVGLLHLVSFLVACLCARSAGRAMLGRLESQQALVLATVPALLAAIVTSHLGIADAASDLGRLPSPLSPELHAEGTVALLDQVQAHALLAVAIPAAFAAVTLLAGGASVDDRRAPSVHSRRAAAVVAGACGTGVFAFTQALGAPLAPSAVALALLLVVVGLGLRVAHLVPFAERHGDADEVAAWKDGVLAAGVLAGTSLALLGHVTSLYLEAQGLDAAGAKHIAPEARAAVAAELARRVHAVRVAGVVEGGVVAFAFAALFAGGARDGRRAWVAVALLAVTITVAYLDRESVAGFLRDASVAERLLRAP